MIQRIQSLYLLMTTLFSTLFLWDKILRFKDDLHNQFYIKLGGIFKVTDSAVTENIEKMIPVTFLLLLIPLVSIITIFVFKNRKLQMRITAGLTGLIIIMIIVLAVYSLYMIRNYNAVFSPGINLILPVLMLICAFLAYRGIRKDEELVRSFDRLR